MIMQGILGKKLGMTRMFVEEGKVCGRNGH